MKAKQLQEIHGKAWQKYMKPEEMLIIDPNFKIKPKAKKKKILTEK